MAEPAIHRVEHVSICLFVLRYMAVSLAAANTDLRFALMSKRPAYACILSLRLMRTDTIGYRPCTRGSIAEMLLATEEERVLADSANSAVAERV